jgi:hypothetical protein
VPDRVSGCCAAGHRLDERQCQRQRDQGLVRELLVGAAGERLHLLEPALLTPDLQHLADVDVVDLGRFDRLSYLQCSLGESLRFVETASMEGGGSEHVRDDPVEVLEARTARFGVEQA